MYIEVETGALIFAIISVTLTGIGCLFTIGSMVAFNIAIADAVGGMEPDMEGQTFILGLAVNAGMSVTLCFIGVAFAFSVVLIKGVIQKRPSLVMAYFVYGTLKNALVVCALLLTITQTFNFAIVLSGFVGCIIYGLILIMIYKTYKKFLSGMIYQNGTKELVEDQPCKF